MFQPTVQYAVGGVTILAWVLTRPAVTVLTCVGITCTAAASN